MRRWIIFIATTIMGFLLDIGTKYWAFHSSGLIYSEDGSRKPMVIIPGWFDITLAKNTGAAFSLFAGEHTFFMIISVVAILTLVYFVHIAEPMARFHPFIFALILAGVLGNFWDRVTAEAVRDFISVHTPDAGFLFLSQRHEWPTFNVADIWICVGAVTMALASWKQEAAAKAAPKPAAPKPS